MQIKKCRCCRIRSMQDTRWDDPNFIPISNGPLRTTTSPNVFKARLVEDGQYFEFLLPYPTHIVDEQGWKPLECTIHGNKAFIEKPIRIFTPYEPEGRIGNESPEAFCSILRVKFPETANQLTPLPPLRIWPVLESLVNWIRVKARHYWLLHGHVGFGAAFRGSRLVQQTPQLTQQNFASYGPNLIVRPLTEELWTTLAAEMNSSATPPISEAMFCDALLSVTAGDQTKSVLELGVAAEIEISHLLGMVAQRPPNTSDKLEYAQKGDRRPFLEKLNQWPQRLGLEPPSHFSRPKLYVDWVQVMDELYDMRGSVAHSGKLRLGKAAHHIWNYAIATNTLFAYCRAQRQNVGLISYSYPVGRDPYDQLLAFRDGEFSYESSPLMGTFA